LWRRIVRQAKINLLAFAPAGSFSLGRRKKRKMTNKGMSRTTERGEQGREENSDILSYMLVEE